MFTFEITKKKKKKKQNIGWRTQSTKKSLKTQSENLKISESIRIQKKPLPNFL
jgi:hypothetical protein